jgi:hypothetical protein
MFKFRKLARTRRRGITLIEVLMGATISMLLVGTLAGFSRFQGTVWLDGMANTTTQAQAESAIGRLAPTIRTARKVVMELSTSTRLTLLTPVYNADGSYVIPLEDGSIISYYLSDTTGDVARTGNILWRSVNGAADSAWSLKDGRGRTVLSNDGLNFTYMPNSDPDSVIISVTAYATAGTRSSTFPSSEEVLLRNKGL